MGMGITSHREAQGEKHQARAHRACGDPRPVGPFLLHTVLGSEALLSMVCVSLHAVGPAGSLTYRIYGCRGADLPRGDRESVLDGSITRPAHASKYLGTYILMAGRSGVGFWGHGHAVAVSGLESVISCGNSLRARARTSVSGCVAASIGASVDRLPGKALFC